MTTISVTPDNCPHCGAPAREGDLNVAEPVVTRNSEYVMTRGRYEITYDGWQTWAFTIWGARRAARRLKRQRDRHGTVISIASRKEGPDR